VVILTSVAFKRTILVVIHYNWLVVLGPLVLK